MNEHTLTTNLPEKLKRSNGLEGIPRAEVRARAKERKEQYLALYKVLPYFTLCAQKIGVEHKSVQSWVETDPVFRERFEALKHERGLNFADKALRRVVTKMEDEGKEWLAVKVLETYDGEWKASKQVVAPTQVNVITGISNPNQEELPTIEANHTEIALPGASVEQIEGLPPVDEGDAANPPKQAE